MEPQLLPRSPCYGKQALGCMPLNAIGVQCVEGEHVHQRHSSDWPAGLALHACMRCWLLQ